MSYCRRGADSDAYVWTDGEHIHISLPPDETWERTHSAETPAEALALLEQAREDGHRVPEAALERLRSEAAT